MTRFTSVLIANRGEIALRILRTAQRMGYRVVAVYSDADSNSAHVRLADQAIRIGPPAAPDSYRNIAALIAAARSVNAGAVHPGYGFLAENAEFAQAVVEAGLVWIGPPPAAIRSMGDKANAKQLMLAAGVPCVPGYDGAEQDDSVLEGEAARIGYPLMIKATAGGGGRGMRLVSGPAGFAAALTSARSEARTAFGSDAVLLERAIRAPRHVEIQVFADEHGHVVHLGERDCSVQRRHQKLIEEAPSPALAGAEGQRLRRRMGDMAVTAARAIGYRGAGTVECLLDAQNHFFFMEMNTRLQVEHPVTEALTGYDLVEWQLRVAQGEPLPQITQETILQRFESGGHAIEVRLCAEDPATGFLPQSGMVLAWQCGPGVRVDHALEAGHPITPHYDSMVAKLIAHSAVRHDAATQLAQALRDTVLLGVRTNQAFLARCLEHPTFGSGQATTAFVGDHVPELLSAAPALDAGLAGLVVYAARALQHGHDPTRVALPLAWSVPITFALDGMTRCAGVRALGGNRYQVQVEDTVADLVLESATGTTLQVSGSGGRNSLAFARDARGIFVSQHGRQSLLEDQTLLGAARSGDRAVGLVRAAMAGRIVALHVRVGQSVSRGDPLVVLEAMKMEHPSLAPMAATVTAIHVASGAQVAAGTLLLELEAVH